MRCHETIWLLNKTSQALGGKGGYLCVCVCVRNNLLNKSVCVFVLLCLVCMGACFSTCEHVYGVQGVNSRGEGGG